MCCASYIISRFCSALALAVAVQLKLAARNNNQAQAAQHRSLAKQLAPLAAAAAFCQPTPSTVVDCNSTHTGADTLVLVLPFRVAGCRAGACREEGPRGYQRFRPHWQELPALPGDPPEQVCVRPAATAAVPSSTVLLTYLHVMNSALICSVLNPS